MDMVNNLLAHLSEECCEVSQCTSKAHRFGIDDVYTHIDEDGTETVKPEMGTNRFRLVGELNDLYAVVEMLVEQGVLPADWQSTHLKERKKKKVLRYLAYSRKVGAVVSNPVHTPPSV